MPKIHRHRGVTTEVPVPVPVDPDVVEVLTDTPDDAPSVVDPGELVDAIVVDVHGDDAAAVADVPPAPARRSRKTSASS